MSHKQHASLTEVNNVRTNAVLRVYIVQDKQSHSCCLPLFYSDLCYIELLRSHQPNEAIAYFVA